MVEDAAAVIYWDSSAILSALFEDSHSKVAVRYAGMGSHHLISTLAYVETCAVVSRMKREKILGQEPLDAALETLDRGPWRHLNISPDREIVRPLAMKWPIRGADLWHLAAAKTIQTRLPEVSLLTFDKHLEAAARGEGLVRQDEIF